MVSEHAVIFWLAVLVGCALSVAALVAFVIVRTWWIAIRPSQEFRIGDRWWDEDRGRRN